VLDLQNKRPVDHLLFPHCALRFPPLSLFLSLSITWFLVFEREAMKTFILLVVILLCLLCATEIEAKFQRPPMSPATSSANCSVWQDWLVRVPKIVSETDVVMRNFQITLSYFEISLDFMTLYGLSK
jgi:hypothetical protein